MTMKNTLYPYIGGQIQKIRQRKGLTQSDLADILDISRTSLVNIEHGRQALMLHTLIALTQAFRISLLDLLPKDASIELPKKMSADLPTDVSKDLGPEDRASIRELLTNLSST